MKQTALFPAIDQLLFSVAEEDLSLPTLPGIAHEIQGMIDDINYSATQVVAVISGDPAIAAQVVKAANSGTFADWPKVDNVRAAVSRLGYKALRKLVTNIIDITDHAQTHHPVIKQYLDDLWEHSQEVAAYCYILARDLGSLDPDQAMLAGLVHDIGTLPLCLHAEKASPRLDHATIEELIWNFRPTVGEQLLRAWNFPDEIVTVTTEHEVLHRFDDNSQVSYSDVVAVANLLNHNTAKLTAWDRVAPLEKLHLSPAECSTFNERRYDEIRATRTMLFFH